MRFAPDNAGQETAGRDKKIIRTSIIGIVANVFLAGFKAVIGLVSGSIAVVLDAVNNLSDAASSIITIVGTKLAGKSPDKKHPFGYGRIEYLSAMIIAVIVLYAGVTSLEESVKKILNPQTPDYTVTALIIIGAGVVVKLVLGRYVKAVGEEVNSDSLINSGEDSKLDSVISAATLIAAIIYLATGVSLEAWLAAIISVVIIKSGIEMLKDTISKLLGEKAGTDMVRRIKGIVTTFPDVNGAYDLVLNNYGPDRFIGSIHIEIPDTYSAAQMDELIRNITDKVYAECNVYLAAVGVYSQNTTNKEIMAIQNDIKTMALSFKNIHGLHGFYLDEEHGKIRFDLVISLDETDRPALYDRVMDKIRQKYPNYDIEAAIDTDFSE
ncbi:MAG: cation diffusion facilitator family transporter [Butyrivibrio sp.]|nr:cation diffusion facilitator family transporter [Butyrivibrio sp.]